MRRLGSVLLWSGAGSLLFSGLMLVQTLAYHGELEKQVDPDGSYNGEALSSMGPGAMFYSLSLLDFLLPLGLMVAGGTMLALKRDLETSTNGSDIGH